MGIVTSLRNGFPYNHKWRVIASFAATGLVGPAIRILLWPPSQGGLAGSMFIYSLVILLWPMQVLSSPTDEGIATLGTAALVAANMLLFASVGVIAALSIRVPPLYVTVTVLVFAALFWWAMFGAGFDPHFVNWGALLSAFAILAVPFVLGKRFVTRDE